MASFISGLSLLILVLINGCFTLPISEIHFPDFTASTNYDGLTTENTFQLRTAHSDDLPMIPSEFLKRSENEGLFSHTETYPTVSTHLKRTLSGADKFDFTTATDASRQERMGEGSFTFTETTAHPFEYKRAMEEPSTFKDMQTTEFSATIPHEYEFNHDKRGFLDEDATSKSMEKSNDRDIYSRFTTDSMPLFSSTSSAVAPELYTPKSAEFNFIETSTRKYVGSLVDPAEDREEQHVEDSHNDRQRPEKEDKPKDEEEHREEEPHHETVVDTDEQSDRSNKRPTSSSQDSVDQPAADKYLVGALLDQDSSKYRPTLPSDFAVLDESVVPVTAQVVRSSTTTKAWNEENKLNQGAESS